MTRISIILKGMILMTGKWDKKKKKDTATTTQNTTTTAQNTQAPTRQTLDIKEIVASLAGDHGELRGVVKGQGKELGEQRTELDELKARVDALEGKKKAPADKVVDAFCYYPGGDTGKPLSDPTENFWVAVQAGKTKVVQVKARRDAGGKLTVLSPEEAAKYA